MPKTIVWFRQDLRIQDNPALFQAAQSGDIIPLYILDDDDHNPWPLGGASKWWLHHSLKSLIESGVPLVIRKGKPLDILLDLQRETGAEGIFWNRCYEPYSIERDKKIKEALQCGESFNGSLLFEPWTQKTSTGNFYKVFTPFWKSCLNTTPPRPTLETPTVTYSREQLKSLSLDDLDLLPKNPNWASEFSKYWEPGEKGAHKKLDIFIDESLSQYAEGRDVPSKYATSRLSPHLHFGDISPHQIWDTIHERISNHDKNVERFLAELGWREFSYNLLYHFTALPDTPFQDKFGDLPWRRNSSLLEAWQQGMTGYPLVDAGMRELWTTGYMHNRVRMVVASLLTKHCMIPWQEGESWFWDTLVDADLANNAASWQWVAGCGADAAPFFRIFNPVTQSQKFDPEGLYIRKWVPELEYFDNKYIHTPWLAPEEKQKKYKCIVGSDYPSPIVDLKGGREKALDSYNQIK